MPPSTSLQYVVKLADVQSCVRVVSLHLARLRRQMCISQQTGNMQGLDGCRMLIHQFPGHLQILLQPGLNRAGRNTLGLRRNNFSSHTLASSGSPAACAWTARR